MNVQLTMTNTEKRFVLLSDIIYNLLSGNEFEYLLYLPTYLGVFCFPLCTKFNQRGNTYGNS